MPHFRRTRVRFIAWLACSLAVLVLVAPTAHANERAERLFEEGKALLEQGSYAEACPKFEESYQLTKGVGAQYFLARCIAKLGKTGTAYRYFSEVAEISSRVGQRDRADTARERMKELEPQLLKLRVTVDSTAPGLQISVDGQTLPRDQWGRAIPLDPGTIAIEASAPGSKPWTQNVTLDQPGKTVDVVVPDFTREGVVDPDPIVGPDEPGGGPDALLISGIAVGVLGVAGLAISGGLAGVASSTYSDSDAFCDDSGCDQAGLDLVDDARSLGNAATAVFVVGGVLLAGGVTMIIVSLVSDDEDESTVDLGVGPTKATVTWHF